MKLLIYLGIGALLCIAAPAAAQTVILVRHAEKMDQSVDPQLSEAGRARAQALATALSGTRLTHILVTPLQRTTRLLQSPLRARAFRLSRFPLKAARFISNG